MARVQIFLSTVSAEFRSYRDRLRRDLTRPNVSVAVQEDFIVTGTETLDMLDDYIRQCDAVIHLVGDMTGAPAQVPSLAVIRQRYPDISKKLPSLTPFLDPSAMALSYTQWEAWLALYHGKPLILAVPEDSAPRDERYELIPNQRAAQQAHLKRLAEVERYPLHFANVDRLAVEILRSKLQEILALAEPPRRPVTSSDPNLLTLLRTVKRDWIEGVRANSLHEIVQLELGKESYARAIDHPLKEVIELEDHSVQELPSNTRIVDVFRRTGDFLLILGEPGSGKTITLLDLANDLIAATEADSGKPVPVVLNLSTWKESDRDLTNWIIVELKSKYFIGERLSKKWLKDSRLLLLLDGLDEVKAGARAHCVTAINAFLEESTPPGMVVACRFAEYEDLPIRLRFRGAIKLLPLTTDQIDQYLAAAGLEAIHTAVQGDAQLRELARTPLVLNIMVLAYKDEKSTVVPIETDVTRDQLYKNLMDRYIAKMFRRKGSESKQPYTQETVLHSLSWLARRLVERSQTVFLIESLQPDWLAGRAAWAAYWIGTRVTWAAIYGLFIMIGAFLLFKLTEPEVIESVEALDIVLVFASFCCAGGITGLIDGRLYRNRRTVQLTSKGKRFWIRTLLYSGTYALLAILSATVGENLSAPPRVTNAILSSIGFLMLYLGPLASFRSTKREAHGDIMTKTFGWSWKRAERGYMWAILSIMVLFGFEIPVLLILDKKVPTVIGMSGVCTTFVVLAWPYFRYRARQETAGQISFLSKMGMVNYLSASIRLIVLTLTLGLIILFGTTMLEGRPNLDLQGIGAAFVAIVGMSLYIGIVAASFSGIKPNTIESTTAPNQGIILTFRHAMLSCMLVFLIGTLLVCGPLFFWSWIVGSSKKNEMAELSNIYLVVFGFVSMTVGLWYGTAVLRHFFLRLILYRQDHIPHNWAGFLDYATTLIFLHKVGGGYVFIHRLVMEHFASLNETPPKSSPAVEIATNR